MNYRRCHVMFVEVDEFPAFHLEDLFAGGSGLRFDRQIHVLTAHLDTPCNVSPQEVSLLLETGAETWVPMPESEPVRQLVMSLVDKGLLVTDNIAYAKFAQADMVVRTGHWWPLSAVYHRNARWSAVDSVSEMESNQLVTAQDLVRQLGVPPLEALPRSPLAIELPSPTLQSEHSMLRRVTCRNYDQSTPVQLDLLSNMLAQVLMAHAYVEPEDGVRFLKKNVPSAGSLHPVEAYVIARNVSGLAPAIYHYHPVAHELSPTNGQPKDLDLFCQRLLSGQYWFADAHVIVVLVCRFERNYWKYRNHAKAYRAVVLDAGHISQAFYAEATLQGLGAFVTAAINETEVEAVLSLEPLLDSPLAVCGFGWRARTMRTAELDPAGQIWRSQGSS